MAATPPGSETASIRVTHKIHMEKKRILVTGGTGFLGSYLIRYLLAKGASVRALKRSDSRFDLLLGMESKVEWVDTDITDIVGLEAAFQGVHQVYHCAALVSFHPRDVARMMQVNVEGTANIVNLCLEYSVEKLVFVSSIASIGRAKDRPHLDETCQWVQSKSNTQYAISKYLAEQEVWRGAAEGLKVGIVNPAIILGSGYWETGSARFFKQLHDRLKFWPPGQSGFVDVRDVVRFMVFLMESEIEGERYILNADNLPYKVFFEKIAKHLDVPVPPIKVTPFLAELAWRVEWVKEKLLGGTPMVTRESARTSLTTFFYSNKKSLGVFHFKYTDLDQTISQTAEQFKEAVKKGLAPMALPFKEA